MDRLVKIMRIAFASEYSYYIKAQNFHWNVEGVLFKQFHDLFSDIYNEVGGSIDDFAENIRKLGAYAPGSFDKLNMLSKVEDSEEQMSAEDMVRMLLADSEKLIVIFKTAFKESESVGEYAISDFIAARLDAQQKHAWMLRSTLK